MRGAIDSGTHTRSNIMAAGEVTWTESRLRKRFVRRIRVGLTLKLSGEVPRCLSTWRKHLSQGA